MENLSSNGKLRDKAVTRRSDLKGDSSKHRESSSSKLTKRWQPVLYKTGRFVLTQFIEQSQRFCLKTIKFRHSLNEIRLYSLFSALLSVL